MPSVTVPDSSQLTRSPIAALIALSGGECLVV
jgi:hypothetical protein